MILIPIYILTYVALAIHFSYIFPFDENGPPNEKWEIRGGMTNNIKSEWETTSLKLKGKTDFLPSLLALNELQTINKWIK